MAEDVIRNDEPSIEDSLSRKPYTKALARMAATCETPLVAGLYGSWGIGKTSMLQQIKAELDAQNIKTIWFDPWQHQFDDHPALALLHTAVRGLGENTRKQLKATLISLTAAFSSVALKVLTGIDASHIKQMVNEVEEEQFVTRERQVQLREHFEAVIRAVQGKPQNRIVFFIDDLDRCMPPQILSLLEALKLYLNIDGCVYFLGLDRHPIELGIQHEYKTPTGAQYLDKIIQLPFQIPPIAPESMVGFVKSLLPQDLDACSHLLISGLGSNPRQVKRFINTLTLNHLLAIELNIPEYDPRILALVLIIQLRNQMLYEDLVENPNGLRRLVAGGDAARELSEQFLKEDVNVVQALKEVSRDSLAAPDRYIYLTQRFGLDEATRSARSEDLRLSQPITGSTVALYTKWKYAELPIDEQVQEMLLQDIDHHRYQTLEDLEKVIDDAREFVVWHRSNHPELFESGTSFLTKSLGYCDPDFREKHRFGSATRNAYKKYEHDR